MEICVSEDDYSTERVVLTNRLRNHLSISCEGGEATVIAALASGSVATTGRC